MHINRKLSVPNETFYLTVPSRDFLYPVRVRQSKRRQGHCYTVLSPRQVVIERWTREFSLSSRTARTSNRTHETDLNTVWRLSSSQIRNSVLRNLSSCYMTVFVRKQQMIFIANERLYQRFIIVIALFTYWFKNCRGRTYKKTNINALWMRI